MRNIRYNIIIDAQRVTKTLATASVKKGNKIVGVHKYNPKTGHHQLTAINIDIEDDLLKEAFSKSKLLVKEYYHANCNN